MIQFAKKIGKIPWKDKKVVAINGNRKDKICSEVGTEKDCS